MTREALQTAFQGMQTQSGSIHVSDGSRSIEQGEDLAQTFDMRLLHASGFVVMVERRQTLVPDVAYHEMIVPRYVTGVK